MRLSVIVTALVLLLSVVHIPNWTTILDDDDSDGTFAR